jgi:hypothetical protein
MAYPSKIQREKAADALGSILAKSTYTAPNKVKRFKEALDKALDRDVISFGVTSQPDKIIREALDKARIEATFTERITLWFDGTDDVQLYRGSIGDWERL